MDRSNALNTSSLFDEATFYKKFLKDLAYCSHELIIESPYITSGRMKTLWPTLKKLLGRGVKIYFLTRDPREHELGMEYQSEDEIRYCEELGIQVLLCAGNHHRKLAILDRKVLWEGSLNILSQAHSREIMRRIEGKEMALQMFNFLRLDNFI
ncbi:MAG: DNA topoisomerase I [Microgenomates group bacterium Gr01-1014_5]|nr:MAG: DNA topoisomerase I [Microgenomates group bacterium Gr01-1014_5]